MAWTLIERDEVVAIAGPITSAARDAMTDTMERYRTPLPYGINFEGGRSSRCLFFFHTVPNQSAGLLMRYLCDGIGRKYYLLGADYVWPRTMFRISKATIRALGGQVLGEQFIPMSTFDSYSSIIDHIRTSGADVLMLALPGADRFVFTRQARESGLLWALVIGDLEDTANYAGADHPGESGTVYSCVPFVASHPAPGVQTFVERIRGRYGSDALITSYVMTHYNALMALKAGLERSVEVSREAAIEGMDGLKYEIPTGDSQITAKHHQSVLNMYICETQGGAVRVVKELDMIEPTP